MLMHRSSSMNAKAGVVPGHRSAAAVRVKCTRKVLVSAAGRYQCAFELDVAPTEADVGARLCARVAAAAKASIAAKGSFLIAVPGGSVLKMLNGLKDVEGVDWGKVHLWYVNHKVLAHTDPASTHKKAVDGFAAALGVGSVAAPLEPAPGQPLAEAAAAAAADYEARLRRAAAELGAPMLGGVPRFDMVVVGAGADGHIGSLYPNKPTLAEATKWATAFSKSADAASITLTLPVMSAGRDVVVCMTGAKKAPAVKAALEGAPAPGELPVAMLSPAADARAAWLLDAAAAAELSAK